MARRSIQDRNTRSLYKLGNGSYALTLPVEHVRALRWQNKQKLTVEIDTRTKALVVRDWRSPRQKRK